MTWSQLPPALHLNFWFDLHALPFTPWIGRTILIIMAAFLVIGVLCFVLAELSSRHVQDLHQTFDKSARRLLRRIALFAILAGISGWFFHWTTAQNVPVFSMRFWFVVWFVITILWGWVLVRVYLRMRHHHVEEGMRADYEKWLPKPKGK